MLAIVCTAWPSDTSGGATFEDDVLRALIARSGDMRLVIYPDVPWTRAAVRDTHAESRVRFVAPLVEPSLGTRAMRKAARMIGRGEPFKPFGALSETLRDAGAQFAWLLGGSLVPLDFPYVATVWDLQHRVQPWFPEVSANGEWRERERLFSELVPRASAVVVGTEVGAREVRTAYGEPPGSLHVLPLPTPAFALDAATAPLPPRVANVSGRYLFYPAQFWAHKNHLTLVRALGLLCDAGHDVALVLTGADRGTLQHVLREADRLGVRDRVHLPGFVDRATLLSLYRHAEALVFPSLFGPDNLPPLEAMALGCPVIAARVDGADEQLGDAALLVDPLDPRAYAAAVRSLATDSGLRDALVARGRARASRWTAKHYADAAIALLATRVTPIRALWP